MKKAVRVALIVILCLVLLGFIAFRVSPWPRVLMIRHAFNKEAVKVNLALEQKVPDGVMAITDQLYDHTATGNRLDVYFPDHTPKDKPLPVIVWIHGGGWVSGNKNQVANYCKIVAGKGYTVIGLDYTIAPERKYPTPIRQTLDALRYIYENAARFHADTSTLFLAGDSGGAHIAAQTANVLCVPSYASLLGLASSIPADHLKGLLLYCGAYDAEYIDLEGPFGGFLKTVLWSYSGRRDFKNDAFFKTASVINYVTPDFPPSYISAGNADPLLPQSLAFARKLRALSVQVDTLFFPDTQQPALGHEYQFRLGEKAGLQALNRSIAFLAAHSSKSD